MCRERAENTLEPHLCHRGLLLVGEPSNTQRQCLGWWQEVKKPQWKGGDQRWCQSWDRCAQWKSFWGGKRHSHQRQGAEDKVLRRRQPGETMGHWVSVAGATGAREQQTRGYVRWSMGFWGHAREEEGILRYCQRSLDNVSVPHSREAKHSKFYTSQVLEPSSSKTGFNYTTVQNLLTYFGFKSFAHNIGTLLFNPGSCVPGRWSLPIILCISIISIHLDNQQCEKKKWSF